MEEITRIVACKHYVSHLENGDNTFFGQFVVSPLLASIFLSFSLDETCWFNLDKQIVRSSSIDSKSELIKISSISF